MRFIRSFNLVDWCLQVIIENLDLFINSKTVPQKHVDFLLRLYSEDVFRRYSSLNTITEDCMLWFLNPHSKKITLSTVTENVIKQLQIVGSTITSLNLHESLAAENILNSIVCCVPHLMYLDFSSTYCSDKTLLCLQRMCPDLVALNVKECEAITDEGMKNLCGSNHSLKELDITYTNVEMVGVHTILKRISTLQCLKYDNMADVLYCIHEQEFITGAYESIQYSLTELIYESLQFTDDPLRVIWLWTIMCPKVKKIYFQFPVNEEVLQTCTRFQNLEEIKIKMSYNNNYIRIKDVLAPILQVANNLRTLILSCVGIPTITLIESFKNLKCLCLLNVYFTDFIEEDIKTTETKLDTLVIKDTNFEYPPTTYKAIALLISLSKNVTKLYLNRLNTLPHDIFHIILNSMKNLTFVDLSYSKVKLNSVIHFFEIPSMKMMYLDLCNCFSFDKDPALKNVLAQNSTCTLSWRIMNDNSDDSDSDVLSDACVSIMSD